MNSIAFTSVIPAFVSVSVGKVPNIALKASVIDSLIMGSLAVALGAEAGSWAASAGVETVSLSASIARHSSSEQTPSIKPIALASDALNSFPIAAAFVCSSVSPRPI